MFWIKACQRCRGDLQLGKDAYGSYISCIQCSTYLTPSEEAQLLGMSTEPRLTAVGFAHNFPVEALAA